MALALATKKKEWGAGTLNSLRALLCAAAIAAALSLASPSDALATVNSTDEIGGISLSERGLTVALAPDVTCAYGLLVDSNGNVLWSRAPDDQSAMASITKVMTAILVLEDDDLTMDSLVDIGTDAAMTGESAMGLVAGTQVSVYELMKGLLVHSGNDCAVALADAVAGSTSAFVDMMNAKAAELGMTNTNFTNVNGLDEGDASHHSSASDIVLMCRYAMQYDEFKDIVSMQKATISNGSTSIEVESTNLLLGMMDGVKGIKTGYTALAGNCLASAIEQNETELYCVVLGCPGENDRFTDSQTLYEWAFRHYQKTTLATEGQEAALVPLSDWTDRTVTATVANDVSVNLLDYNGSVDQVITLRTLSGKITKGQVVGSVQWTQNDKIIASCDLVSAQDVAAPAWFDSISTTFKRLWAQLFGGQQVAQSETLLPSVTIPAVTEA